MGGGSFFLSVYKEYASRVADGAKESVVLPPYAHCPESEGLVL